MTARKDIALLFLAALIAGCATDGATPGTTPNAATLDSLRSIHVGDSDFRLLLDVDRPWSRVSKEVDTDVFEYQIGGVWYLFESREGLITKVSTNDRGPKPPRDWSRAKAIAEAIAGGMATALANQGGTLRDPPIYIAGANDSLTTTVLVPPGMYRLSSVRRIGQDQYTYAGSQKFRTAQCSHDASGGENAIYDTESRTVVWSDASSCRVLSIFQN